MPYHILLLSQPLLNQCHSLIYHSKAFENFFLPPNAFSAIPILVAAQKDDPVFSTVYTSFTQKQRPYTLNSIVKAYSFLYTYYK